MRRCLIVLCCAACGSDPHAQYAVDPAQSLLETDRDVAVVGGDTVAITVTLRDGTGEPIAGADVELSATGNANRISIPDPTDADGVTHAMWTSTKAEQKSLGATAGGATLGPSDVTFLGGAPQVIAFVVPPADVTAGAPMQPGPVVQAFDDLGNPAVTHMEPITIALLGGGTLGGTATVAFSPAGSAGFADLHIDVVGTYRLVAHTDGLPGAISDRFAVLSGDPDPAQSTLVALPPTVDADGVATTTLTGTFINAQGLAIAGAPVALTATGSNNTFSPPNGTTDATGHFTATLASRTAEQKTVSALVGGTTVSTTVEFVAPACVPMLPGAPWTQLSDLTGRLIVADVDADGHLDAILTEGPQIMVYRGRGDGSFLPGRGVSIGAFVFRMVAGDFDGDGHVDIAYITTTSHWLARGTGDGHLMAPVDLGIQNPTFILAAGDFNHDGKDDLVVDGGPASMQVLFGQAGGTFAPGPTLGIETFCADVAAADLDGDGNLDVVASCSSVEAALGRGDGTFAPLQTNPTIAYGALTLADVNGDGFLDALLLNVQQVWILLGTGTADFAAPITIESADFIGTSGDPTRVSVRDIDGDGHADLVVPCGETISVLHGAGDGTFTSSARYATDVYSAVLADMTGDGIADLVSLGPDGKFGTVLGLPGGGFLAPRGYPRGGGVLLAPGDFNGDGRTDVVDWDDGAIRVGLAGPDGVLQAPQARLDDQPTASATGDVDGDGKLDLVVVVGSALHTMLGTGTGGLQPFTSQPGGGTTIALADLDGDGRAELISTGASGISVAHGLGNGTFGTSVLLSPQTGPTLATDLDGDGVTDIAVFGPAGTILVYSAGSASPVLSMTGGYLGPLTAADFDGDGHADIAILTGNTLAVMRGLGGDMFAAPLVTTGVTLLVSSTVHGILAADMSGDGAPDIVIDSDAVSRSPSGSATDTSALAPCPTVSAPADGSRSATSTATATPTSRSGRRPASALRSRAPVVSSRAPDRSRTPRGRTR